MPARNSSELHTEFAAAFNAGDIGALLALYEPDATLVADNQPAAGHDAIREVLYAFLALGATMQMETRLVIESPDGLALLHGRWKLVPPSGGEPLAEAVSSEVARRQPDGTWKFILDNPMTPQE